MTNRDLTWIGKEASEIVEEWDALVEAQEKIETWDGGAFRKAEFAETVIEWLRCLPEESE